MIHDTSMSPLINTLMYTCGLYEMLLNYWVIVERYPFPNGVVGSSIPIVKSSLYVIEKTS